MSEQLVSFSKALESSGMTPDLAKELRIIESQLNLTPTEKVKGQWVPSTTNVAVMNYMQAAVRKVSSMLSQGLTFATGDYYIYASFGGRPAVSKSPNGMIKAMSKLAKKQGYDCTINVGCVFEEYNELRILRDGCIDTLQLENSPEYEIKQHNDSDILAPYAVVSLFRDERLVSRKVTIVRNNEYTEAKNQSKGYTHKNYPVPMAQKIALHRAANEMMAALGVEDEDLQQEIKDHREDYDMQSKVTHLPKPTNKETIAYMVALEENDGLAIFHMAQTLDQNVWIDLYNSGKKGEKVKQKELTKKLETEGREVVQMLIDAHEQGDNGTAQDILSDAGSLKLFEDLVEPDVIEWVKAEAA